jgi:hypothetical protein
MSIEILARFNTEEKVRAVFLIQARMQKIPFTEKDIH